jgi:parallel beta-helix repeat protein
MNSCVLASVLLLSVASSVWAQDCVPVTPVCTKTIFPGTDVIQLAIDTADPGDTICLLAGIYPQTSSIDVDKPIALIGPKAGFDPRPSAGSTRIAFNVDEALILGNVEVTASNVTLEGLAFTGDTTNDLISSPSSAGISNLIIRFNIITDATIDEGIQIRDCSNCLIEYNHVFNIAEDGINMCCGSEDGIIRNNEVHDSNSANAAIYIYDSNRMEVSDNLVYASTRNDGIKMGEAMCRNDPSAPNGVIERNTVHDTAQVSQRHKCHSNPKLKMCIINPFTYSSSITGWHFCLFQ